MSFYSSKSWHLSEYTLKWFTGLFDGRPELFPLSNKLEVWVSCAALCYVFVRFFVWFLKMESNPLPDLWIIEIGLFYGGELLKWKYANCWQDGDVYLIEEPVSPTFWARGRPILKDVHCFRSVPKLYER